MPLLCAWARVLAMLCMKGALFIILLILVSTSIFLFILILIFGPVADCCSWMSYIRMCLAVITFAKRRRYRPLESLRRLA